MVGKCLQWAGVSPFQQKWLLVTLLSLAPTLTLDSDLGLVRDYHSQLEIFVVFWASSTVLWFLFCHYGQNRRQKIKYTRIPHTLIHRGNWLHIIIHALKFQTLVVAKLVNRCLSSFPLIAIVWRSGLYPSSYAGNPHIGTRKKKRKKEPWKMIKSWWCSSWWKKLSFMNQAWESCFALPPYEDRARALCRTGNKSLLDINFRLP